MNYFKTQNKEECCGCSACISICPKKCIEFIEDKEGFSYPSINRDNCIQCGLCERVCPFINHEQLKNLEVENCYALKDKSNQVIQESASGGAFSAIIRAFSDETTKIIGVELCDDFCVRHTVAHSINEAKKFSKSKYVESSINGTYIQTKEFLDAGYKVIFSGTGCQIAGLKGYLKKEHENLLTIDLVCHGVPSKKVFKKYLEYIEEVKGSKIEKYTFRSKNKYLGMVDSHSINIRFQNGDEIHQIAQYDYYMRGFLERLYNRKSCYKCPFADSRRCGDITLGDFWGLSIVNEKFDSKKGVSLVICNTSKGEKIFSEIKNAEIFKTSLHNAKVENHNLVEPTPMNKDRKMFFMDIEKLAFNECIDKYSKPINRVKENIIICIKYMIVKLGILGKVKKIYKMLIK